MRIIGVIAGDGSLVLKLFYRIKTYTVSFVDYDGDVLSTQQAEHGSTSVTAPANPTRTGYTFAGWDKANSAWASVTSDLTVKATYTPIGYTVKYDKNDGIAPNPIGTYSPKYAGDAVPIPNTVMRPGYTFDGWHTNKSADAALPGFDAAKSTFTLGEQSIGTLYSGGEITVTLYAVWTTNTNTEYKVEHYRVTSTGTPQLADTESLRGKTGASVTAKQKEYPGYTFSPTYNQGVNTTVMTGDIADNGSLVLKLYYTADLYNVSFDKNASDATGAMTGRTVHYGEGIKLAENNFTRPGYDFVAWNTRPDGLGAPYADEEDISQWNLTNGLKLYAQWTAASGTPYTVKHYKISSAGTELALTEDLTGETNTAAYAQPKAFEGYSFAPTHPDMRIIGVITGDGSLTLQLFYRIKVYTASFVDYDGDILRTQQVEHGSPVSAPQNNPARTGYTFTGWDKDSSEWASVTSDLTIKATYDPIDYTVVYDKNDGVTNTIYTESSKHVGDTINIPNTVMRPGYTFDGWHTNKYATSALPGFDVTKSTFTLGEQSIGTLYQGAETTAVLYAVWTANTNTEYTVEHYKVTSDGTPQPADTDYLRGKTGNAVTANQKEYPGYTFDPGYDEGGNVTVMTGAIAGDGSLVLKLYYTADAYSVSFDRNAADAVGAMASRTVYYSEGITLANNTFTRPGYDFVAWSTKSDGSGAPYADGAEVDRWDLTNGLKLYAQWTASSGTSYTVEHYKVSSAGTFLDFTENLTGVTNTVASAKAKAYEGYTFALAHPETLMTGVIAGNGSLVLRLYYRINTYTVSFVNYNGNVLRTQQAEHGSMVNAPTNPVRTGYTFAGWDKDSSAWVSVRSDATIRAMYHINTYTVTFVDYDGRIIKRQTVDYGDDATAPGDPKRAEYKFTGWSHERSAWQDVSADVTVSALYEKISDDDGSADNDKSSDTSKTTPSDTAKNTASNTASTTPSNTAKTTTTPSTSQQSQSSDGQSDGEGIYRVRYDGNGATGGSVPLDVNMYSGGTNATVLGSDDLSKESYAFEGWSTDPNAADASYRAGDRVAVDNNITLFAVWKQTESIGGPVIETTDPEASPGAGAGDASTRYIGDSETALGNLPFGAGVGANNWSLVSLLLAFAGFLLMILSVMSAIGRGRKNDEYLLATPEDADTGIVTVRMYGTHGLNLLLCVAAGVVGAIAFILMNDMSRQMVLFNSSTMVLAIVFAMTLISAKLAPNTKEEENWETENWETGRAEA
jgi:uncharacterized repeat protein (TIGR02543 family)